MADIRDVAKRAGVHISTVSRVLSHPNVVATATRRRVEEAIKALAYSPNSAASNLRKRRSGRILVITPSVTTAIFPVVLRGLENAAHCAGYAVLLGNTSWGDAEREERFRLMMVNREADGLIFMGPVIPKAAVQLIQSTAPGGHAPVVNVLSCDPVLGIPSVHIDSVKAGYEALDYLYGLGHSRISLITASLQTKTMQDRARGAFARAREAGDKGKLKLVEGDLSIEAGRIAAEQLLRQKPRPTAIFCASDELAIGALDSARQLGIRVPRELSIMGCDDIPFAQYTDPALTTITHPMDDIGQTAVRVLLDLLGGQVPVPVSVVLPHRLCIRASTAPPPKAK